MGQKIRQFGLIGYPLSHSFSPDYFAKKFESEDIRDAKYDLFPLEKIEDFEVLIQQEFAGLNVTLPYKQAVIPYLDHLSEEAKAIGAVNTIKFKDGKTYGYNTDVFGFRKSLTDFIGESPIAGAMILGTGGAAKAVSFVLDQLGISYISVSRTGGDVTYDRLKPHKMQHHNLIVNTTPLGMSPFVDKKPAIPYDSIDENFFLFDLIYNPEKTIFLKEGKSRGCSIKNGLEMLALQAEGSWEIWNSKE